MSSMHFCLTSKDFFIYQDEKINPSNNCVDGFYTKVNVLEISGITFEIKNNTFKNILLGGISVLFDSEITISDNSFEI